MDVTVSDPMVGRLLDGRYRVGRRVARGGMATVYQAVDTRLHRTVAVKVLHAGLAENGDFVRRFHREAQSAARLSHPNIVAVFDQGEDDGMPYLTMEYVSGQTLRQALTANGRLKPARALEMLDLILQALAVAHEAGLVHRDVKPENVLLGDDGSVKVADFGLARAVSATTNTASQGLLIGTVSYLAPEQVTHGHADARADVYAVGIMLYEMLVGAKPHDGDSPIQVAYKHVNTDVPAPSLAVPDIPAFVDGLVLRATARDPDVRPADARVLLRHVRRARTALAQGVDDPELTQDLTMFRRPVGSPLQTDGAVEHTLVEHTLVAPFDAVRAADGAGPRPVPAGREPTPPRYDDYTPDGAAGAASVRRRPWWRRTPAIVGAVVVLLLATGGGLWLAAVGPFTRVPAVVGQPEGRLAALGARAGVEFVVVARVFSEQVPKGRVVRAEPGADQRAFRGGTVQVWVSRGPERHAVPPLTGMTVDRVRPLLEASSLRLGEVREVWDDQIGAGRVIRSEPRSGTLLRRGDPVSVVVSKGREPVEVANVVGADVTQATAQLEAAGLKVTTTQAFSDTVPVNAVISQDPGPGRAYRGDTVALTVSKGPEFVPVPDVMRWGVEDAKKALTDAGFQVEVRNSALYVGINLVASQTPGPGQLARVGSTIVIELV